MLDGAVETPRIVGLNHGAGVAGLLLDKTGKLFDGRSLTLAGGGTVQAAQPNALAAVLRFDSIADLAAASGGAVTLDQDYAGYDVIAFVNLTGSAGTPGITLNAPKLGFNGSAERALALDGYLTLSWDATKQKWVQTTTQLDKLIPGAVWITLVREDADTEVTASVVAGGTTYSLNTKGLPTTLADDQAAFIEVGARASVTASDLQGLDDVLLVSGAGGAFYGIDKATNTLVVVNSDGTVRQAFRQGADGQTQLGDLGAMQLFVTKTGIRQLLVNATNDANVEGVAVFTRSADNSLTFSSFDAEQRLTEPMRAEGSSAVYSFTINSTVRGTPTRTTTLEVDSASASLWSTTAAGVTTAVVLDGVVQAEVPTHTGSGVGPRVTFSSLWDMRLDGAIVRINAFDSAGNAGQLTLFRDDSTGQLRWHSFDTSFRTPAASSNGEHQSSASAITYVSRADVNGFDVYEGATLVQQVREGVDGARGATNIVDFAVVPGGKYVLALSESGSISVFARDDATGTVTGRAIQVFREGSGGAQGLVGASAIVIGPQTGNLLTVYVASTGDQSQRGGLASFTIDLSEIVTPRDSVLRHAGVDHLSVATGAGSDSIRYANAVEAGVKTVTINTGGGTDTVVISDSGASTSVDLGDGADVLSLRSVADGAKVTVRGGAGADRFEIVSTGSGITTETTLTGEGGADIFEITAMGAGAKLTASGGADDDSFALLGTGTGAVVTLAGEAGADSFTLSRIGQSSVSVFGASADGSQAGDGIDTVSVNGKGIHAQATTSLNGGAGADALLFDPGDGAAVTYTSAGSLTNPAGTLVFEDGQVEVSGFGRVRYSSFGVALPPPVPVPGTPAATILPPTLSFATPAPTREGQGLTLRVDVTSDGGAALRGSVVSFDLDGDGRFGDRFAEVRSGVATLTLSWLDLVSFGMVDDGRYTIAVEAVNEAGLAASASARVTVADTAPSVTATAIAASVVFGEPAKVVFASSDPSSNDRPTGWRIDWGDGTILTYGADVREASHVHSAPGDYAIVVSVFDADHVLVPTAATPVAVRVVVPATPAAGTVDSVVLGDVSVAAGENLQLSVVATGTPTAYLWSVNGQAVSSISGANPTIGWSDLTARGINRNGTFADALSVTVVYGTGPSATNVTRTADIVVVNTAPRFVRLEQQQVGFEGASTPDSQAIIRFVGATDATATDAATLRYSFDFDNDGVWDIVDRTSSSVVVPTSFAQVSGTLVVRGQVKDAGGLTAVGYAAVTINDVAPVLTLTGTGTASEGTSYTLELLAEDPGILPSHLWMLGGDKITGWTVDWGDGDITTLGEGVAHSPGHVYRDDGLYTVTVTARDSEGSQQTAVHQVTVANVPPVLTGLATSGPDIVEGGTIRLTGTMADVGTQDARRLSVAWGDGTTTVHDFAAGTTRFDIAKTYLADSGATPFAITATLSDRDGGNAVETVQQVVRNAAPVIAELALSATQVSQYGDVVITGRYSDAGTLDSHRVTIDLGDGTSVPANAIVVDAAQRSFVATARFSTAGQFTVRATVADSSDSASKVTASATVTVVDPLPSITDATVNRIAVQDNQRAAGAPVVTIAKGGIADIAFSLTDPGQGGVYAVSIDWGDGTAPEALVPVSSSYDAGRNLTVNSYAASHPFSRSGAGGTATTISVLVGDNGAAQQPVGSFAIRVTNALPVIETVALTPASGDEGGEVAARIVFSDADLADTHGVVIDWGDGTTSALDAASRRTEAGRHVFSATHRYADEGAGAYVVTAKVADQDAGVATASATAGIVNVKPEQIVLALNTSSIVEGETVTLTGSFVDPGLSDSHVVTIDWGHGGVSRVESFALPSGLRGFSAQHVYEAGARAAARGVALPVTVSITDNDGAAGTKSIDAVFSSAAPVFEGLRLDSAGIVEGGAVRLTGRIADADLGDNHRVSVDWGDGSALQIVTLAPSSRSLDLTHRYADDARSAIARDRYTVTVTAVDDVGATAASTLDLAVANVAPTVNGLTIDGVIDENGTVTLRGRLADVGVNDVGQLGILWGDEPAGARPATVTLGRDGSFTISHQYLDDARSAGQTGAAYKVTLITSDGVDEARVTREVTVRNVAPTMAGVSVTQVVDENGFATLVGRVADVGTRDILGLTVFWGDEVPGALGETVAIGADGSFTATHRYRDDALSAGRPIDSYKVVVTVADNAGATSSVEDAVTVRNLPPGLDRLALTPVVTENGLAGLTGVILDEGMLDGHVLTVDWGDGTVEDHAFTASDRAIDLTHRYLDDGISAGRGSDLHAVKVSLKDSRGATGPGAQLQVQTVNAVPVLEGVNVDAVIDENGLVTLTGRVTDAGTLDTHTLELLWGDEAPGARAESIVVASDGRFTATHRYFDDAASAGLGSGRYTVTMTARDNAGAAVVATAQIEVRNLAPAFGDIVLRSSDDGLVTVAGTVGDTGPRDTLSVLVLWGDGRSSTLAVDATGAFSGSYRYGTSGEFTLSFEVSDNGGARFAAIGRLTIAAPDSPSGLDLGSLPTSGSSTAGRSNETSSTGVTSPTAFAPNGLGTVSVADTGGLRVDSGGILLSFGSGGLFSASPLTSADGATAVPVAGAEASGSGGTSASSPAQIGFVPLWAGQVGGQAAEFLLGSGLSRGRPVAPSAPAETPPSTDSCDPQSGADCPVPGGTGQAPDGDSGKQAAPGSHGEPSSQGGQTQSGSATELEQLRPQPSSIILPLQSGERPFLPVDALRPAGPGSILIRPAEAGAVSAAASKEGAGAFLAAPAAWGLFGLAAANRRAEAQRRERAERLGRALGLSETTGWTVNAARSALPEGWDHA